MIRKLQQKLHSRHITKRVLAVMGKPQKAVSSSLLWHGCKKFAEFYKAFPNIRTTEIREGEWGARPGEQQALSSARPEHRKDQGNVKF